MSGRKPSPRDPLSELTGRGQIGEREPARRPPISFNKENAEAVYAGFRAGTYDVNGVAEATRGDATYVDWLLAESQTEMDAINSPHDTASEEGDEMLGNGMEMLDESDAMAVDMLEDEEQQDVHDEEQEDHQIDLDQIPVTIFDARAMGLREINNLGRCRVSTYKPGNGVAELLSDDLDKYWQSDGVQPHRLTYKFVRMVEIRAIRFYVDYNLDESYTPTHIVWHMGTGEHDLVKFAESRLTNPVGWQDVPIAGCGGGDDGNSLCCFVVQMHVRENHQNGKDTHIRGLRIYGFDEHADPGHVDPVEEMSRRLDTARRGAGDGGDDDDDGAEDLLQMELERRHIGQSLYAVAGLDALDFAEEPIIR